MEWVRFTVWLVGMSAGMATASTDDGRADATRCDDSLSLLFAAAAHHNATVRATETAAEAATRRAGMDEDPIVPHCLQVTSSAGLGVIHAVAAT